MAAQQAHLHVMTNNHEQILSQFQRSCVHKVSQAETTRGQHIFSLTDLKSLFPSPVKQVFMEFLMKSSFLFGFVLFIAFLFIIWAYKYI